MSDFLVILVSSLQVVPFLLKSVGFVMVFELFLSLWSLFVLYSFSSFSFLVKSIGFVVVFELFLSLRKLLILCWSLSFSFPYKVCRVRFVVIIDLFLFSRSLSVFWWSSDGHGQLGHSQRGNRWQPTLVTGLQRVSRVVCGDWCTFAVVIDSWWLELRLLQIRVTRCLFECTLYAQDDVSRHWCLIQEKITLEECF